MAKSLVSCFFDSWQKILRQQNKVFFVFTYCRFVFQEAMKCMPASSQHYVNALPLANRLNLTSNFSATKVCSLRLRQIRNGV